MVAPTGAWVLANPVRAACPAYKAADFCTKMRLRCSFEQKNRPPPSAARENRPARALRAGRFSVILIPIHKFLTRRNLFMDDAGTADGNLCATRALALRYDLYKAKLARPRLSELQN